MCQVDRIDQRSWLGKCLLYISIRTRVQPPDPNLKQKTKNKKAGRASWCTLAIPVLWRQMQGHQWSLLAGQLKFQATERSQPPKVEGNGHCLRTTSEVDLWPLPMCAHVCTCTHIYTDMYTHTDPRIKLGTWSNGVDSSPLRDNSFQRRPLLATSWKK